MLKSGWCLVSKIFYRIFTLILGGNDPIWRSIFFKWVEASTEFSMPIFPSLLDVKVTRLPLPLSPGGKSQASAFTEARNEEGKHSGLLLGERQLETKNHFHMSSGCFHVFFVKIWVSIRWWQWLKCTILVSGMFVHLPKWLPNWHWCWQGDSTSEIAAQVDKHWEGDYIKGET